MTQISEQPLRETKLPGVKVFSRGKVRDVYDLGRQLLIVATDRISAFDCVMPNGIPDKGKVLTQLSEFWFRRTSALVRNHLLSTNPADYPAALAPFYTQRVDWKRCGDGSRHECATVEVPVDYAKPAGDRFTLAVRKAIENWSRGCTTT